MNRTPAALVLLASVLLAGTLEAQAPGYQQIDPRSVRAEYTAEVLDRVNDLHGDWSEAWSTDQLDDLIDLYWEEAVLIPHDRAPLRGHDQIREYLAEVLPNHGQTEGFMLDFDASGGMATIFGNYMIQMQAGPDSGTRKQGPLVTVYMRRGRTWKVRTQVFIAPPTG